MSLVAEEYVNVLPQKIVINFAQIFVGICMKLLLDLRLFSYSQYC